MRSDGTPAALIIDGGAVVASAMICPGRAPVVARRRKHYFG
jgi:hypothetical protein